MANEDFIIETKVITQNTEGGTVTEEKSSLIKYDGARADVIIPECISTISSNAFAGKGVTSVVIPQSVEILKERAFAYCKCLTSVSLPSSSLRVCGEAFGDCTALEEIFIPAGITVCGPGGMGWMKYKGAFFGCKSLRKVTIAEGAVVEQGAFDNCPRALGAFRYFTQASDKIAAALLWLAGDHDDTDDVEALTAYVKRSRKALLDAAVQGKDDDARLFYGIMEIASARISLDQLDELIEKAQGKVQLSSALLDYKAKTYSVSAQDKHAEYKVKKALGMTQMTVEDYKAIYKWDDVEGGLRIAKYVGTDKEVVVPEQIGTKRVVAIGDNAFRSLDFLIAVHLPDTVMSIGARAFFGCTSLAEVSLPKALVSVKMRAFANCPTLAVLNIAQTTTDIATDAFCGCTSLVALRLDPQNSAYTFADGILYTKDKKTILSALDSLKGKVIIPKGVTQIEAEAFRGCVGVTAIELPTTLKSIGEKAFSDCTALRHVDVPNGVTAIGGQAFLNCVLSTVDIPASVRKLESIAFGGIVSNAFDGAANLIAINVDESNKTFTSVDGLLLNKNKTNLMRAPQGKVGECVVPDGVTTIGYNAFDGCAELTAVRIPATVTKIEESAFSQCGKLRAIHIPDTVTKIEDWAFYRCSSLTEVVIPASVVTLGEYAFKECAALRSVHVLGGITKLQPSTFDQCIGLEEVVLPACITKIEDAFTHGCAPKKLVVPSMTAKIEVGQSDVFAQCTLYAPEGSKVEKYAKANGVKFEAI